MVTIKVKKKEYQINDINFSEKRKLHMLNSLCFSGSEINQTKYYEMLELVRDFAGYGNGTENENKISTLSMVEVDTVLQTFLMEYLGLNREKK